MTRPPPQQVIAEACEAFFREHGDNHLGMGWPRSQAETDRRYQVMLDVVGSRPDEAGPASILDLGCGLAHLYEYLLRVPHPPVRYVGVDVSETFIEHSQRKHPDASFLRADILGEPELVPTCDFVIMNGLLTMRCGIRFDEMWAYARQLISAAYGKARVGLAFNVMTKHVDWEREDLFHLPLETLSSFLVADVSRHFSFRHDYGLFDYTAFVYREPRGSR